MTSPPSSRSWASRIEAVARQIFHLPGLRDEQEQVIQAMLAGQNVVCQFATGAGKSIVYQIPALLSRGMTLIVLPHIALIKDQLMHLHDLNLKNQVEAIANGLTDNVQYHQIIAKLSQVDYNGCIIKMLYICPERFESPSFRDIVKKLINEQLIARIHFDEAHCMLDYATQRQDFCACCNNIMLILYLIGRPAYHNAETFNLFQGIPKSLTSATILPSSLVKVVKLLGIPLDAAPLYRPNLQYAVYPKTADPQNPCKSKERASLEHMARLITGELSDATGIIFCSTTENKETNQVVEALEDITHGAVAPRTYYANLPGQVKNIRHEMWSEGKLKLLVATTAIALGTNNLEVQYVIHWKIPRSLEAYYQESGRAGRDGKPARCILYFAPEDVPTVAFLLHEASEENHKSCFVTPLVCAMVEYAIEHRFCRVKQLGSYFQGTRSGVQWFAHEVGEDFQCGQCDTCCRRLSSACPHDISLLAWQIIQAMTEIEDNSHIPNGLSLKQWSHLLLKDEPRSEYGPYLALDKLHAFKDKCSQWAYTETVRDKACTVFGAGEKPANITQEY
ncbi:P-loop containing nucleoside triphosphate hydrolase protein [Punctularia strigosozonata HHB-11173 SS5]|uniref:P-loop containing nucleoside triphosphate hydrolase protein n=1 Tax=Punctularia strigosozonata (strain HHB-11173) TaxID=741275 RepID=UPI0004416571|nr:P-loop containing nucleoside triphosphate hydrolase protein [Punctularia strigosozonata HHB-11173 SS5]EIN07253.1 P-loop containing nucleoside triphosphate hydrolase protein [Punctularia strigosozonata HHB-11173 SS5]